MILGFADKAWEDYIYWTQNDKKILKRINLLLADIKRNPHDAEGIGKPERLKENYITALIKHTNFNIRTISQIQGIVGRNYLGI